MWSITKIFLTPGEPGDVAPGEETKTFLLFGILQFFLCIFLNLKMTSFLGCVVSIGETNRCVHEWNGPIACLIPLRWAFQTFFSISVPKIIKTCSAHHLNWISRAGRSSWDRHWSESPHRQNQVIFWSFGDQVCSEWLWDECRALILILCRYIFLLNPVNLNFF